MQDPALGKVAHDVWFLITSPAKSHTHHPVRRGGLKQKGEDSSQSRLTYLCRCHPNCFIPDGEAACIFVYQREDLMAIVRNAAGELNRKGDYLS